MNFKTGYCTRLALTRGIFEVKIMGPVGDGRYTKVQGHWRLLRLGRNLFETREAAEENAREQAKKALRALATRRATLTGLAKTPRWAP